MSGEYLKDEIENFFFTNSLVKKIKLHKNFSHHELRFAKILILVSIQITFLLSFSLTLFEGKREVH